ncbi:MAG: HAD family hydrolase [Candidatus Micrarchaeia archaeon]
MKFTDFELYIFDFDGTLSMPTFLVRVLRFFKRRYNLEFILSHKELFKKTYDLKNLNINNAERQESFYSSIYFIYSLFFRPKIKESAKEVLKELRKKHKKIALFSDGKEDRIRKELTMLGLEEYFDIILAADSIKIFKPNPTPLVLIAKNMRIPPSKTVYIGDMVVDVLTAKFAKMGSCAVGDGLGTKESIKKVNPNFFFENLKELKKELG